MHLRASQINGCSVCVDMHARDLRRSNETDERLFAVAAWRDAPYFTDAERAALALTEALTRLSDRRGCRVRRDLERSGAPFRPGRARAIAAVDIAHQRLESPEQRHPSGRGRVAEIAGVFRLTRGMLRAYGYARPSTPRLPQNTDRGRRRERDARRGPGRRGGAPLRSGGELRRRRQRGRVPPQRGGPDADGAHLSAERRRTVSDAARSARRRVERAKIGTPRSRWTARLPRAACSSSRST